MPVPFGFVAGRAGQQQADLVGFVLALLHHRLIAHSSDQLTFSSAYMSSTLRVVSRARQQTCVGQRLSLVLQDAVGHLVSQDKGERFVGLQTLRDEPLGITTSPRVAQLLDVGKCNDGQGPWQCRAAPRLGARWTTRRRTRRPIAGMARRTRRLGLMCAPGHGREPVCGGPVHFLRDQPNPTGS